MDETKIHERLADTIVAAVKEVCSTMLGFEVEAGVPSIEHASPTSGDGVVTLIGLAGDWIGTGSITCSGSLACKLSGLLLMSEYSAVDDEVLDAVAEITNMVIGGVKTTLEEELGNMGLSIPTVIYGRNFATRSVGSHAWTVVPFRCGDNKEDGFQVQVCLTPNREGQTVKAWVAGPQPWQSAESNVA